MNNPIKQLLKTKIESIDLKNNEKLAFVNKNNLIPNIKIDKKNRKQDKYIPNNDNNNNLNHNKMEKNKGFQQPKSNFKFPMNYGNDNNPKKQNILPNNEKIRKKMMKNDVNHCMLTKRNSNSQNLNPKLVKNRHECKNKNKRKNEVYENLNENLYLYQKKIKQQNIQENNLYNTCMIRTENSNNNSIINNIINPSISSSSSSPILIKSTYKEPQFTNQYIIISEKLKQFFNGLYNRFDNVNKNDKLGKLDNHDKFDKLENNGKFNEFDNNGKFDKLDNQGKLDKYDDKLDNHDKVDDKQDNHNKIDKNGKLDNHYNYGKHDNHGKLDNHYTHEKHDNHYNHAKYDNQDKHDKQDIHHNYDNHDKLDNRYKHDKQDNCYNHDKEDNHYNHDKHDNHHLKLDNHYNHDNRDKFYNLNKQDNDHDKHNNTNHNDKKVNSTRLITMINPQKLSSNLYDVEQEKTLLSYPKESKFWISIGNITNTTTTTQTNNKQSNKGNSSSITPITNIAPINSIIKTDGIIIDKSGKINEERTYYLEKIKELEGKLKIKDDNCTRIQKDLDIQRSKYTAYEEKIRNLLGNILIINHDYKRKQHKIYLYQQRQKLGQSILQREGSKFIDTWIDGLEILQTKQQLGLVIKEKDELQGVLKKLYNKNNQDILMLISNNTTNLLMKSLDIHHHHHNIGSITTKNDILDMIERINSRIISLTREEQELKEKLQRLDIEKIIYIQEYKKQCEEDNSRYGKFNPQSHIFSWPMIKNRYQLVSLIGKGGSSEVYKAFDLHELHEVACKIHQLNPIWSENTKENYLKHTQREIKIHKKLTHPNIIKLYDTIHFDNHTFATILEYCDGPDLSLYLKKYKTLSEKDAKIYIKQILAGLKYLNDIPIKVIHYDIKPQNIIFNKGILKLTNFSACKLLENNQTHIPLISPGIGTYCHLPPECLEISNNINEKYEDHVHNISSLINNKVDIWSVGMIFYEMLYGIKPFGNNITQEGILEGGIVLKSYNVNFPNKPNVSLDTKEFIKKCLAYKEHERIDIKSACNHACFKNL